MQKTKTTLPFTAIALANLALTICPTSAGVLFSDDFENPDVDPSYDVDGYNDGAAYTLGLVTFAPGADRKDTSTGGLKVGVSAVLATTSGVASGAYYETKSFSYTADGTENTLGQDLAVRIEGATKSANIDNVVVSSNSDAGGKRGVVRSGGGGDTNFSDWISAYPGVGGQTDFDDDADGDGIVNGLENFFGTAPDQVSTGLRASEVSGGGRKFTFTHPENPTPANIISSPVYQWTTDQETFHPSGSSVGGTTVTFIRATNVPSPGTTTVTGVITGDVPEEISVNVTVTLDP